jgi:hypothetical protein
MGTHTIFLEKVQRRESVTVLFLMVNRKWTYTKTSLFDYNDRSLY